MTSTIAEYEAENERLRSLVEEYRQRELAELRQRVTEAEHAAQHYRSEAERNASAAKELVSHFESKISELQTKLNSYEQWNIRKTRSRPG